MSRPLLITDCDEVLLHMIGHFAEWVGDAHGLSFDSAGNLYVEDWNFAGRVTKLRRVSASAD